MTNMILSSLSLMIVISSSVWVGMISFILISSLKREEDTAAFGTSESFSSYFFFTMLLSAGELTTIQAC